MRSVKLYLVHMFLSVFISSFCAEGTEYYYTADCLMANILLNASEQKKIELEITGLDESCKDPDSITKSVEAIFSFRPQTIYTFSFYNDYVSGVLKKENGKTLRYLFSGTEQLKNNHNKLSSEILALINQYNNILFCFIETLSAGQKIEIDISSEKKGNNVEIKMFFPQKKLEKFYYINNGRLYNAVVSKGQKRISVVSYFSNGCPCNFYIINGRQGVSGAFFNNGLLHQFVNINSDDEWIGDLIEWDRSGKIIRQTSPPAKVSKKDAELQLIHTLMNNVRRQK